MGQTDAGGKVVTAGDLDRLPEHGVARHRRRRGARHAYYRPARNLRVAFAGGNAVRYVSCAIRASDGSPRNCDTIGTGTYTVTTAGDAGLLRFAGLPAATTPLTYERIYVERAGEVFYGYHDKLKVDNTVRLNAPATDALLGRLGIGR